MQKGKYVVGAVFAAIFVLLTAGGGWAIHFGVSQFVHVKGGTSKHVRVYNPTGVTMFALTISYEEDETFQKCEGFIITPHGSAKTDPCTTSGGCSVEIISVPTGSGIAGALNHRFGLRAKADKGESDNNILDPLLFSFELDAVRQCACDELANAEKSPRLLARFGIRCP